MTPQGHGHLAGKFDEANEPNGDAEAKQQQAEAE
jgi:hypothetical protein